MAKDVSILVLSWNTRDYLRECLASIPAAAGGLDCETICIDNASSDGSADMVASEFPWVRLVRNEENVGYARGNNQAYELSCGEIVLLLNSDIVLPPNAIQGLADTLRRDASIGMVVAKYLNPDGTLQREMYGRDPGVGYWVHNCTGLARVLPSRLCGHEPTPPELAKEEAIEFGATACAVMRRATVERLGQLFDERFPLFCNDADLCKRIHKAGQTVLYTDRVGVLHYKSKSVRQISGPWQIGSLISGIRYCAKHHGISRAAVLWLAVACDLLFLLMSHVRSRLAGQPGRPNLGAEVKWHLAVLLPVNGRSYGKADHNPPAS